MTLMTHQMILPDARTDHHDTKGANVRFKSCKVVERRDWPHRNREHEFTDGIVQVWEALSPEAYESRYPHVDSTLTHEPLRRAPPVTYDTAQRLPVPPPAQISRYKMALFGLEKASRLRCCLIVDGKASSPPLLESRYVLTHAFSEKSARTATPWRAKLLHTHWNSSKRVNPSSDLLCIAPRVRKAIPDSRSHRMFLRHRSKIWESGHRVSY